MRRILALAAACSLVAGAALAEHHEGDGMHEAAAPAYQLDLDFVCGSALDSQGHYADNLIAWLQARCQDGFIGADVCKEINHYVTAYTAQVRDQVAACREKIASE